MAPGRRKSFGEQVSNSKPAGISGGFGAYSNTLLSMNVPSLVHIPKSIGKSTFFLIHAKNISTIKSREWNTSTILPGSLWTKLRFTR